MHSLCTQNITHTATGICDAGHFVMPSNAQQHASCGRHQQALQNAKHITGFLH
jgi:hypothetical protein